MYIRYIAFAIPAIVLVVLAFLLSPALAGASVLFGVKTLPGFLQWFSTVDDTLDGGQRQHPDKYPAGVSGVRLWWQRTCWICRNPAQGFQAMLFGYPSHDVWETGPAVIKGTPGGAPWKQWRRYRYYSSTHLRDADLFSYQRHIPLRDGWYWKLWLGWAIKDAAGRASLKVVPISFGRVK